LLALGRLPRCPSQICRARTRISCPQPTDWKLYDDADRAEISVSGYRSRRPTDRRSCRRDIGFWPTIPTQSDVRRAGCSSHRSGNLAPSTRGVVVRIMLACLGNKERSGYFTRVLLPWARRIGKANLPSWAEGSLRRRKLLSGWSCRRFRSSLPPPRFTLLNRSSESQSCSQAENPYVRFGWI
jgi:hypothetical protein